MLRRSAVILVGILLVVGSGTAFFLKERAVNIPKASKQDIAHNLDRLQATAAAGILLCSMKIKLEYLNSQMGQSAPYSSNTARIKCVPEQEHALEEPIGKAKDVLAGFPTASPMLKDWYSEWVALLENLPLNGSDPDTSALDEKFQRIRTEANW